MKRSIILIHLMIVLTIVLLTLGCSESSNYELSEGELQLVNRQIAKTDSGTIYLNAQTSDGLAIIQDVEFRTGTIEIDLKGENTPGRSFVGLAFNIQNDSTYEAIYFRAFNFKAQDEIRRKRSIQYVYHPTYTWRKLRTEHEGQYESEYLNAPNPQEWFSTRIVIDDKEVTVIDPNTDQVLLKVDRLSDTKSSKIGLWAGNNSKGGYRALQILN